MIHHGDQGQTNDFQGNSLPKNSKLINALGELDELIAHLGLLRYICPEQKEIFFLIQKQLSCYASNLANFPCGNQYMTTTELDKEIDQLNQKTPFSNQFYLPGEKEIPIFINLARTVTRRAERSINVLETPPAEILQFINRLSTYLFALQMYYHFQK